MSSVEVTIPTDKNWSELKNHMKLDSFEEVLMALNEIVQDDELKVQTSLVSENGNIQIIKHPSSLMYKLFIGQNNFLTSRSLMEVLFYGALLHTVFDIKLPATFANMFTFLMVLTGNDHLARGKLPQRVINNLMKKQIFLDI